MTPRTLLAPALAGLLSAGCEGVFPGIDLQQMNNQHKFKPYQPCPYFPDGRAMQAPPRDTISRDRVLDDTPRAEGLDDQGDYVPRIPVPLTRASIEAGRRDFEVFCAPCHGVDGSGHSEVALNMELRRPPSLVDPPVTTFPAGRIFQVISHGYGLMPSYRAELTPAERWAVVAWTRVLARSQRVRVSDLPPAERAEVARELSRAATPPPARDFPAEPNP